MQAGYIVAFGRICICVFDQKIRYINRRSLDNDIDLGYNIE